MENQAGDGDGQGHCGQGRTLQDEGGSIVESSAAINAS